MPKTIGKIELYMGPHQLSGDDNLLDVIVKFIDKAKKRLYIAVQELDSRPIVDAIIRARQRKVLVKLVLEADYLLAKSALSDPFVSDGEHEPNRILHDAILRAKIKVNSDYNPKIFHQKFIVRDGESVLTGSTNFTKTGVAENLNHIVVIHDKKIAKCMTESFLKSNRDILGS